jgi:membrane-associated protease RseP (regulator of RpoE activity)
MEYGSILLIPLIHELGHWLVARLFGASLHFTFEWGKLGPIPVPRWTWRWPDVTKSQLRIICLAGFGMEIGLIPLMPLPYQLAAILHFVSYPFYAGESSDWRGVV